MIDRVSLRKSQLSGAKQPNAESTHCRILYLILLIARETRCVFLIDVPQVQLHVNLLFALGRWQRDIVGDQIGLESGFGEMSGVLLKQRHVTRTTRKAESSFGAWLLLFFICIKTAWKSDVDDRAARRNPLPGGLRATAAELGTAATEDLIDSK